MTASTLASPLACMQLFSSLAAFSAAASQGSYAAANEAVEGAAGELQERGRPSLCVQWGNWGGGGMAARNPAFIAAMERMGLGTIDPGKGLAAMAALLGQTSSGTSAVGAPRRLTVNVFLWKNIARGMTTVDPIFQEFIQSTE